jgi:hypothetical protein
MYKSARKVQIDYISTGLRKLDRTLKTNVGKENLIAIDDQQVRGISLLDHFLRIGLVATLKYVSCLKPFVSFLSQQSNSSIIPTPTSYPMN